MEICKLFQIDDYSDGCRLVRDKKGTSHLIVYFVYVNLWHVIWNSICIATQFVNHIEEQQIHIFTFMCRHFNTLLNNLDGCFEDCSIIWFCYSTGKYYGKSVDWMDSTGKELSLWQSMINRPNFWVEGCVILRSSLDSAGHTNWIHWHRHSHTHIWYGIVSIELPEPEQIANHNLWVKQSSISNYFKTLFIFLYFFIVELIEIYIQTT